MVEAILTVLGAGAAFLVSLKKLNKKIIYFSPIMAAAVQITVIALACFSPVVWASYIGYVCFGVIYHYMITVARYVLFVVCIKF